MPAMAAGPKLLMVVWIIRVDILIKRACIPAGTPILSMSFISDKVSPSPLTFKAQPSSSLRRRMNKRAARSHWAIRVARAAPAIPILKKTTNTISRTRLVKKKKKKQIRGAFVSPKERRIAVPTL